MKLGKNWLVLSSLSLALVACDSKKETAKVPAAPATSPSTTPETSPAKPVVPAMPSASAEARAAKLGFAKYMPLDTEALISIYNGDKATKKVKASKLWKMIESQMGGGAIDEEVENAAEGAVDAAEEAADAAKDAPKPEVAEPSGPAVLFASEFTLAMGKTTGEQLGNLANLGNRQSYFQMKALAKILAAALKTGDKTNFAEAYANSMGTDVYKQLLNDPESGIASIEKASMPPIFAAFRCTEENRASNAAQLSGMLGMAAMAGEMVEPVSVEVAGSKFEGQKLLGKKLAESMTQARQGIDETIGAANTDRLIAAITKKDLVILSGTVGDYAVIFIGSSVDDLKLAKDPASSLVSGPALAFGDAYLGKDIAAVYHGQKAAMDTLINSAAGLSTYTDGLRDGLVGADGLGDTRDLEAMFQIVKERETVFRKLASNDASGAVAFYEEGLKLESFGGYDYGSLDWKSPNKLAGLGAGEDTVLFANMTGNPVFAKAAQDYVEAIMETAYTLTMKVSDSPAQIEELAQFKQMSKLFDTQFRPEISALWETYSQDFGGSLGHEKAWVIDLKGSAPAIPGMPPALLEKAKVPRISIITPVVDRSKIAGSWDKMNTTITSALAKISTLTGQEIPMQKPMSSTSGSNTTWFFPMPFLTDDFVPSVTVGDKWFVASTSKNQALDLIAKADTVPAPQTGFTLNVNFKALEKYSVETLKLAKENGLLDGESTTAADLKNIQDAINILGDLDTLSIHSRQDGAQLHSSVHFKTR